MAREPILKRAGEAGRQVEKQPSRARFRFYAELNDHLPRELQFKTLEKSFFAPSTVKDMVESFGVPHTEIDLIVANGRPVDFAYRVQNGDRIAIYPTFESFDIASEQRLRGVPLRNPKFVLGCALGEACGLSAHARVRRRIRAVPFRCAISTDLGGRTPHPADA